MKLFTIGFTKKSAKTFFEILIKNKVKTVIDIRLNNKSQLAGFTKADDLTYFLDEIAGINYVHMSNLAPSKELLQGYKNNKISWTDYQDEYLKMIMDRNILEKLNQHILENSCLLCSEPTPENCHRRILAEYLAENLGNIDIIHL
ncbi:MAG: DUF488 domain-containing protein [Methanosarcinaceae archaeon]|nr:DUF488 domain-containing protein [Methanosarcinaceae archaeon]